MMKSYLIYTILLVFQGIDDIESQLAFELIEQVFTIIIIALATMAMMLIPVILCYWLIHYYYSLKNYSLYDTENWSYGNTFKVRYMKLSANFYKHFFALVSWNIGSFLYIFFGFNRFSDGLKTYFYFPFHVFESLAVKDINSAIYLYKSVWAHMIIITLFTLLFYWLGIYVGRMVAELKLKKMV